MRLLKRLTYKATLQQKLTAIITLISLIVLLLASGTFILSKVVSYRQETLNKFDSITAILGTNLETAITLKKKHVINSILASLKNEPEVTAAYVFSDEGKPLAHFLNNSGNLSTEVLSLNQDDVMSVIQNDVSQHFYSHRDLIYYTPIHGNSGIVGVIGLQANLSTLYYFIYQFIASTVAVFLLLLLIAFLLAARLQKIISRPIRDLAKTVETISADNDFSSRAEPGTGDEIGDLIQGFNSMLSQLEERDIQLQEYQHNLENLVMQRTRELQNSNIDLQQANRELKLAKMDAEQASKAKSQFLAKMSHEIRTPMIGILGMAEQLTKSSLQEDEQRLAMTVHRSGETLLSILDDVLDFSKIEAGKLELEQIPFSIQDICEDVISIFADHAAEKKLRLFCHIDEDCSGRFLGDPIRIKQILLNLVSNAVKFTHKGEVVLTASCSGGDQENTVWLAVTDTGIGIVETAQDEIFDSFSQADNSMTRKFGGSGLGLSIVRQLTHLMGGSCGLQSTPGKGSTFWIVLDLPRVDFEKAQDKKITLVGDKREKQPAPPFSDTRILLVEDNPTTQQLLTLILGKAGCHLEISPNGARAIEIMQEADYDLVFMDCEMPDMDGFEATRILRERNYQTPIIALTAHVGEKDMARCFESGMNDCLSKPFRQQQLLDVMGKWLPGQTNTANER